MAWMKKNPLLMQRLESFANKAKNAGTAKLGIKMLIERVRWYGVVDHREVDFKINNNYPAYIAREIMRRHPALDGFFELRRTADE